MEAPPHANRGISGDTTALSQVLTLCGVQRHPKENQAVLLPSGRGPDATRMGMGYELKPKPTMVLMDFNSGPEIVDRHGRLGR